MLNERKLTKAEEKRKEELVKRFKKDKRDWVKRYGKDAEAAMYGTAVKNAKKQVEAMNSARVKEAVKQALSKNSVKEEYMEDQDYEDLMALKDATAIMDNIADLYKQAKKMGYGADVKRMVQDLDEELKGGQKKLDKNDNGKIDAEDFKMMRSNKTNEDLSEGASSEEKQIAMRAIKSIAKYRGVSNDEARTDLIRAAKEVGELKEGTELYNKDGFYFKRFYGGKEDGASLQITTDKGDFITIPGRKLGLFMSGLEKAVGEFDDMTRQLPIDEDFDLGHQDNEPHMLKADLYRIGKYAMELYQMVDDYEGKGEVDFPHWWQAKISNAKEAMVGAKHYLDFEIKEPEIDAMVDVADDIEVIDEENRHVEDQEYMAAKIQKAMNDLDKSSEDYESKLYRLQQARKANNKGDFKTAMKIMKPFLAPMKEGLPKGYWKEKIPGGMDESYDTLVKKIKGQGKSEKAAKAIAGAVAAYKAKGGGKGPTAKQKK